PICELLYLLMRTWDEDAIDKDTAALLYMGIVGDTGRFLYNNTTELTLLVASKLIKYGFDASGLITKMHQTSKNAFQYKGYIIDQAEEHTSELQSRFDLVCRLLLEKKKESQKTMSNPT